MRDLKNTEAPSNTTTIDKNLVDAPTNNIYEAISIISKRAVQINGDIKKELLEKLDEFAKKNSINKSALVDRLINNEIDRMNTSIFDRVLYKPRVNYALMLAPADKCSLNEQVDKDGEK